MSDHKKLLSCWHRLEHFSPADAPKEKENFVELLPKQEPWEIGLHPADPEKTIEYSIFLGVFDSYVVNDFIKIYFKDKRVDENFRSSKICFASLKLDINGRYLDESFGISTLPWALHQLEKGKIKDDNWEKTFKEIEADLEKYIDLNFKTTITNEFGTVIKVSRILSNDQLIALQNKVEAVCKWSVKPNKQIYLKRFEKFKPKKVTEKKPDTDILNSFYRKDLEKIISRYRENSTPKALKQFLDGSLNRHSTNRIDVPKNIGKLKNNLIPNNYPDGCWPSGYSLSLMQQFAVNTMFNELSKADQKGMFSVNGPPGTGKTTLLRDIIAPIIVKRAKVLAKIHNPSDAFNKFSKIKITETFAPWTYNPAHAISNAGIVIASSNNGAVENISKELPLEDAVGEQYRDEIDYFKSIAKNCINKDNWGLISAVMGNKKNRSKIINSLWFHKKFTDLRGYLQDKKLPDKTEWINIKNKFEEKLREVTNEKTRLNSFMDDYESLVRIEEDLSIVTKKLEITKKKFEESKVNYELQQKKVANLKNRKKELISEQSFIENSKPGFFSYWFNASKRNAYKKAKATALNNYNQISDSLIIEEPLLTKITKTYYHLKPLLIEQDNERSRLNTIVRDLRLKTEDAKKELGANYADRAYWKNIEFKKSQESCPWYSDRLKNLQSELFIISLKLSEIFILTANAESSRISTTLAGFFAYLKGGVKATNLEVKAMWNTFFLVIPVISTTFASVQTMFQHLGEESIPWLFIDEAGQAIPQAAAGAIWRSQRVSVVGDPFQIEPVVTIPNSITDNISKYFDLNNRQVNSELSVQSMADRINPLGTYLTIQDRKEWIGIPLKVHRRCINPMFDIANKIAYDNTMYNATATPATVSVNFKTSFIHCTGEVTGRHFVQEQAEQVKELLIQEIRTIQDLPDVFVITPFSEISYKLRFEYLFRHLINEVNKYREIDNKEMGDWLKTHVGTIHTFQGKQAEGVILCLGLDTTKIGAADWASLKPNLLNVAITRAKYRFVAIGDKNLWLSQPYFNQLKELGGVKEKPENIPLPEITTPQIAEEILPSQNNNQKIEVETIPQQTTTLSIKETLDYAIKKGRDVKIQYGKYGGEISERKLSDIRIINDYVEQGFEDAHIRAFCHLRNEERTFKINRITDIIIVV